MIIAHDRSWIVCTPTKTGSSSLLAVARRLGLGDATRPRRERHETDLGLEPLETKKRILIVRDPAERLCSTYWYVLREASGYLSDLAIQSPEAFYAEFLRRWLDDDRRPPGAWDRTCEEYRKAFRPTMICTAASAAKILFSDEGVSYRMSKSNVTAHRPSVAETTSRLSDETRKRFWLWCENDRAFEGADPGDDTYVKTATI